ncbi:MAG: metallophosphoesterase, partial [Coriobacteriia bacterium]|nr:metallophosphoesterase [Coriobacteriia bacterium]
GLFGCTGSSSTVPPETTEPPFSFAFFSDSQADPEIGDYTAFGGLLEQALASQDAPRLLLLGGDTVNDGSDPKEWTEFRSATGEVLDGVTVTAVAGNHDKDPLLFEQFDYPRSQMSETDEGYFYSFIDHNIFFLMLDSNAMGAGNAADVQWVADELASDAAQTADWRVVVSHHPFWSVVQAPKDLARSQTMQEVYLPLLESGGVDLILCGHQHVYARVEPTLNGGAKNSGMIQITVASGAKDSYHVGDVDGLVYQAQPPNYLIAKASETSLELVAYDREGVSFDEVRLER